MSTTLEPDAPIRTAGDEPLPVGELLRAVWSRFWIVVLTAVLLAGTALGYSFAQTPEYEASIRILVGQEQLTGAPSNLGSDVQGLQQITQTMAEAVSARPLAEEVIQRLDLQVTSEDFLEENLTVEQVNATQFIEVTYRDSDPETASQVANAVGDVFSEQVSEVSPSANSITAMVWERAETPDEPVSPNPLVNVGAALAAGLMLGVGLALLIEYLDDSLRSPEEVEQFSGLPAFSIIPQFKVADGTTRNKKGGG